ncbi:uncharacterized protein LOC131018513 [Salvia miltiorrhiza]|uniref:uncharacterized protein LOC131018513 n=1 Tax=Salvia miltiorrhiza TaxID=226208 RepID=UPI0025AD740B|nr:uncharacterized protein LOC131018513 [Salvia miltiorrhiza]
MDLANPKFFIELTKTNLKEPFYITMSKEIWESIDENELVVHLTNKRNKWETRYINHPGKKYIEGFEFLMDNDLVHGDILGFELTNKTPVEMSHSVYFNRKSRGVGNPDMAELTPSVRLSVEAAFRLTTPLISTDMYLFPLSNYCVICIVSL